MGNIENYKYKKLKFLLTKKDYWDFYIANDDSYGGPKIITTGDCLVSIFDFNNTSIYSSGSTSAVTISSNIYWTGATNTGYTFDTVGLTGIDNGLVNYVKNTGDTSNIGLVTALTGSTLIIPNNDKRLHLTRVSGSTKQFIYPINFNTDSSGKYAQFCGGFYQGYYKIDGSTYQTLPNRVNKGWVAEFWVKKDNSLCTGYTGTTLNDNTPNNKGFFFYIGTRAENKFWNRFQGVDSGCTSACTTNTGCTDTLSPWCTIPKETNVFISKSGNTIPLYPSQTTTKIITNNFLIYGRASSGYTSCNVCGNPISGFGQKQVSNYNGAPIEITTPKTIITNTTNPFLIFGRVGSGSTMCGACGGYVSGFANQTVSTFSGYTKSVQYENLDYNVDVFDNALGFRIKDDGSIGYRALKVTGSCSGNVYTSGYTIEESYSLSGMVKDNEWTSIIIRFKTDYYDDCDLQVKDKRKGTLMFYINGKLKHIVKNFDEFIAKRLNDHMEKQIGVPFNMSLGGGSQGLLETQTFDGRDLADLGLPIEENFSGSFIGGISKFKFNICDLSFVDIQYIYNTEKARYQ